MEPRMRGSAMGERLPVPKSDEILEMRVGADREDRDIDERLWSTL